MISLVNCLRQCISRCTYLFWSKPRDSSLTTDLAAGQHTVWTRQYTTTQKILKKFVFDDVKQFVTCPRCQKSLSKELIHMSNYRFNLVPLDKVWYTISETKDLLSMSRTTIYKYINDGSLLVVHPNSSQRGVRVPATSIGAMPRGHVAVWRVAGHASARQWTASSISFATLVVDPECGERWT